LFSELLRSLRAISFRGTFPLKLFAAEDDIDNPSNGFSSNERLFLPATAFNRFAVTREINDGLLAPRFAPSQRAWALTGVRVPVAPVVFVSAGRDSDDTVVRLNVGAAR
jgi:hypothetical protein